MKCQNLLSEFQVLREMQPPRWRTRHGVFSNILCGAGSARETNEAAAWFAGLSLLSKRQTFGPSFVLRQRLCCVRTFLVTHQSSCSCSSFDSFALPQSFIPGCSDLSRQAADSLPDIPHPVSSADRPHRTSCHALRKHSQNLPQLPRRQRAEFLTHTL